MAYWEREEQRGQRLDYLKRLITMEPPCRPVHSGALLDEMSWYINSPGALQKFVEIKEFVNKLSCLMLMLTFTFCGQKKRY